jgi:hypothetical protein
MIVIRYNRSEKPTKDLAQLDDRTLPDVAQKLMHADTFEIKGAIFAVVSRKYDIDNNQFIIYVR